MEEQVVSSNNVKIHDDELLRSVGSDGSNDLLSYPTEVDQCSEDELKRLAESLAPRVTSLLNSNEAELEDLLSSEHKAWQEEEEKFQLQQSPGKKIYIAISNDGESDDDEDGMNTEWKRLAVAEDSLREELEMSDVGFKFMTNSQDYSADTLDSNVEANEAGYENERNMKMCRSLIDDEDDSLSDKDDTNGLEEEDQARTPIVEAQEASNDIEDNKDSEKDLLPRPRCQRGVYTLYDHASSLGLEFNNCDLGYPSCPLLSKKNVEDALEVPNFHPSMLQIGGENASLTDEKERIGDVEQINDLVTDDSRPSSSLAHADKRNNEKNIMEVMKCTREYVKPMKAATLEKLYSGFDRGLNHTSTSQEIQNGENYATKDNELLPIRTVIIRIRPDILCGAVMDAVYTSVQSSRGEVTKRQGGHLRALIPGCCIPEEKYQHFRQDEAAITSGISSLFSPIKSTNYDIQPLMALLPPFFADIQLCVRRKSRFGERILLVRLFRVEEGQLIDGTICPPTSSSEVYEGEENDDGTLIRHAAALFQRIRIVASNGGTVTLECNDEMTVPQGKKTLETPRGSQIDETSKQTSPHAQRKSNISHKRNNNYVKQIGDALISPIRLLSTDNDKKDLRTRDKQSMRARKRCNYPILNSQESAGKFASDKLMSDFQDTPSINCESSDIEPIPVLSSYDWPFVQSTWRFLKSCLNELDNRDLAYSTLLSCPFGAFPALPTLDVHYCSQMKLLSRDNMISSLISAAQELEQFAREAEYSCAILIQALRPTFNYYKLKAAPLSEPVPLTAYPLDFEPPEASCPPWGQKVMWALNCVAVSTPLDAGMDRKKNVPENMTKKSQSGGGEETKKSEFDKAEEAVSTVFVAFQKQEDEELSARLCRKNVQVMDRLAKMQAHKRESIIIIRDSYGSNSRATKEADRFHAYIKDSKQSSDDVEGRKFLAASDQVPLLSCRILLGHCHGTCYVSAHQMLLVTQLIPIIGESNVYLMSLSDIEIGVNPPTKSLLNPLLASISVYQSQNDRKEILKFRPSLEAEMFKQFIDTVKAVSLENVESLKFSSKGGLLYMFDEKDKVAKAAESLIPEE